MTAHAVREMYHASKETSFFWIDDVYLFGILTEKTKVKQSQLVVDLANEYRSQDRTFDCFQKLKKDCHILGVLLDTYIVMKRLWTFIY
jgi:hypothetical protein